MPTPVRLASLLFAALVLPASAAAQICGGLASHDAGNIQLGGRYASTKDISEFGVSGGLLSQVAFGQVSLSSISYDDFDGSTLVIGAGGGYRLPLGTSGNAELCPVVAALIGMGPDDIEGTGIDASMRGAQVGVTLGYRVSSESDITMIPTVGAGFAYSSFTLDDGTDTFEDSDTYGLLSFGVGFVLGRQLTALPSVSIPLGLEDADPVLGISLTLSLGARR